MNETVKLRPIRGGARIDVLDVLRGIAVLGILYMNIPSMAQPLMAPFGIGWSHADFVAFGVIQIGLEGTQRGMLELLFGAGMMVIARRAMAPDGPVAVADLYFRRNLWLLVFGLFDVFCVLWIGDILHIYAIAALAIFSFRRVPPRWLIVLGLLYATYIGIAGGMRYVDRADLIARVDVAHAHVSAHQPTTADDRAALARWDRQAARRKPDLKGIEEQRAARAAGVLSYARYTWSKWVEYDLHGGMVDYVEEAFCAMLIGVALWKWRITQGGRSWRFYLGLMLVAYGLGFTARAVSLPATMRMDTAPQSLWITEEYARLAVSIGHVALVNLVMKARLGRHLLAPFKAAGRTAFSLYFLESLICIWLLFAPWGLGWFGRYQTAMQTLVATGVIMFLLVVANIWVHFFANGPLEWLWRSLSYGRRQPFRVRREVAPASLPV